MRWLRRGAIALLVLVLLGTLGYGALFIPAVYFRAAFLVIQRKALMRDKVDWPAVRGEADTLRRGARTTRDTYGAIRLVLRRLGDDHSHLADPETVRAHRAGSHASLGLTAIWPERVVAVVSVRGPAGDAGIEVGDVLEEVDGRAPEHVGGVVLWPRGRRSVGLRLKRPGRSDAFSVQLEPRLLQFDRPAAARRLDDRLGYIDVPGVVGSGGSFDADALALIRKIDSQLTCGWVVDLRRNVGGNMWPMLHALRPILGEGNPFTYRYGKGPWSNTPVYSLKFSNPAIAVLTSRLTVSSGELVTVAFRGPSSTRVFGEATSGLSTSNLAVPMVDGAVLVVTTARASDRTGRVYEGRIEPDERIDIDWTRLGAADDPVTKAAMTWLSGQPQCLSYTEGR